MMKSQKTAATMIPVIYGRGSFQFSFVCNITRTSAEESELSICIIDMISKNLLLVFLIKVSLVFS